MELSQTCSKSFKLLEPCINGVVSSNQKPHLIQFFSSIIYNNTKRVLTAYYIVKEPNKPQKLQTLGFPILTFTFLKNKKQPLLLFLFLFSSMSSIQMSHVDLEQGRILHHHNHHHQHHSSVTGSDISLCFSDADDGASCYSHFYSTNGGGSYDEDCCSYGEASNVADDDCSVEIEIESGVPEIKVHLNTNNKVESRDCRICHLGLESDDGNNESESGVPIELGCSCKDDLAAAHKNCAEAWFKIKGNRTCEICHTIARNVYSASEDTTEILNDTNNNNNSVTVGGSASTTISAPSSSSSSPSETRRFWHGHRFLNFLLACMVFAFVISWLFHFNVPSS